jgi:long-subunit fatty acid transport protein
MHPNGFPQFMASLCSFVRSVWLVSFGALLALGVAGSPSLAQTADEAYRFGTRSPAVGTRASGMGGAGIAGWSDPSALYTNPAGLGYYTTSAFSGGLNTVLSRDESTYQIFAEGPSSGRTEETSSVQLGHLTGIYNAETSQGSLVFALGYNRVATFDRRLQYGGRNAASSITDTFLPTGSEYEITEESIIVRPVVPFVAFQAGAIEFFESRFQNENIDYPFLQAIAPGRQIRQSGSVTREGNMNEWNFAGAVEVAPDVMFGLSANISTGQYDFEHELTETVSPDAPADTLYSIPVENGPSLVNPQGILFRSRFSSEFTGFNLRGGLSAKIVENVRFGFSFETPTWYSVSEEFTDAFIRTTFANGSLTYGDDANEDAGRGQFDYRLNTPWRIGLGLSYNSDPLLVTADVEFVDWSTTTLSSDDGDFVFENTNDALEETYGYVFNWRAGAEYRFDNGLRLRAGGAYRPDGRNFDVTFADGDTEDRSRLFLSAGAGFDLSDQFRLNLAWMQERTNDQFVPYPSVTPPTAEAGAPPIANPIVDETVVRNQIQIGATYQF